MHRRLALVGDSALLLLALVYLYTGRDLDLFKSGVPGGRFLPLLLGIALAVLAVGLLWLDARRAAPLSSPGYHLRVPAALSLALLLFSWLMPIAGYTIACGLLMLAFMRVYDPHGWREDLLVSAGVALVFSLVFVVLMPLQLPVGFFVR